MVGEILTFIGIAVGISAFSNAYEIAASVN
jgi:hypothetical protein